MLGREGVRNASRNAVLNANYMMRKLQDEGGYLVRRLLGGVMLAHAAAA